jgi:sporulation protein YlmC with PRC-barrel domain
MRPKTVQQRKIVGAAAILAGILIGFFGFIAAAQTPDGQESPAEALIGVSVFAAEGTEVGTVSAVTVGQDGQISEIRFTTASRLGLGERTVTVRQDSFIALNGAVVLDLSAEEVDTLPVQTALRGTSA